MPVRSGTTSSGSVEAYIVVRQLGDGTGQTPVFSADSPVRGLFARSTTASVDLAWDAASGATAYLVFRADSGLSNFTQIGQSTSAAYRDASAVPGRVHSYFVEPVNALGRDGRSAVTDGYRALSAPVLWAPTAASSGVSLSWKPVTGASHYRVFRESEIDSGREINTITILIIKHGNHTSNCKNSCGRTSNPNIRNITNWLSHVSPSKKLFVCRFLVNLLLPIISPPTYTAKYGLPCR